MIKAALLDYSGTLFRLDYTPEFLEQLLGRYATSVDAERKVELLRMLTAPAGEPEGLSEQRLADWHRRDLDPNAHRRANIAVLETAGCSTAAAGALYGGMLDDRNWHSYPDTAEALKLLREAGVATAVVSNIAWDIRPRFALAGLADLVDTYVLSFEHGVQKPDEGIFRIATEQLGVDPAETLMIGDSEAADGGARALGARFARVEPSPTDERPDALLRIVRAELGS